jgi:hypothetical protein
MAFALASFEVTFILAGSLDSDRRKVVEFLPVGADIAAQRAQLDTDIGTWMTAFNNDNTFAAGISTGGVSNAFVTKYLVTESWVEADNIPAFGMEANLYLEAQIQSIKEGDGDKASTYIPAPAARIFAGDSYNNGAIDPTDTAFTTFGTLYTDGGGNNALSDGQQWQNPLNVTASSLRTVKSGQSF